MYTPPVSPSSYSVKPSIGRYPWKRSLFTHDDKLASSYSATQGDRIFQMQKHKEAYWHSAHNLSILKAKQNSVLMPGLEEDQCLPPVHSPGNRERDTSCAFKDRGQLNNEMKLFWQRAASGLCGQGSYLGSETAQWILILSEQIGNQSRGCQDTNERTFCSVWIIHNNHVVKD